MIKDVDETIKQILIQKASLEPSAITISFDAPDRDWAAAQSKPAVNLYLYDIRENHELRSYEWRTEKKDDKTATKKKTPVRLDLSYFITVWTKHVEDEHRLLSQVLICLMNYPILPEEMLQGDLKSQEYQVHALTAQPDGLFKNPSDFWTGMDNKLKPSINYIVTMPVDLAVAVTSPLVFTKVIDVKDEHGGETEEILQIGGTIFSKGKTDAVVPNAMLLIKELNITTTSGSDGKYKFSKIRKGDYTFKVSAPKKATKEVMVAVPADNYNIEI
jgi:hypothetical protein